jgi:hypothetical protein
VVSMYESIASMQASLTWDPVMWGCRFEVVDARTCYGKKLPCGASGGEKPRQASAARASCHFYARSPHDKFKSYLLTQA